MDLLQKELDKQLYVQHCHLIIQCTLVPVRAKYIIYFCTDGQPTLLCTLVQTGVNILCTLEQPGFNYTMNIVHLYRRELTWSCPGQLSSKLPTPQLSSNSSGKLSRRSCEECRPKIILSESSTAYCSLFLPLYCIALPIAKLLFS